MQALALRPAFRLVTIPEFDGTEDPKIYRSREEVLGDRDLVETYEVCCLCGSECDGQRSRAIVRTGKVVRSLPMHHTCSERN